MKKILGIVLAFAVLLSLFPFAASAEKANGEYIDGIWHYNSPVTVKVVVAYWAEYTDNPQDKWIYEWAKDKMNIDIQVVGTVPYSAIDEQTNLLFASNELPDALLGFHNLGGSKSVTYGDEAKQLLPIDELIDPEITPNLAKLMEELPVKAFINTEAGHFYVMPEIMEAPNSYPSVAYTPMIYNRTWFKEVGYEAMPTDMDELIDALIAIRDNDPGKVGDGLVVWGGSGQSPLLPFFRACGFYNWQSDLFNFVGADYLSGGELVATGLCDNYYEYLKVCKRLYDEGLVEQDLYTLDDAQVSARLMEGKYGAAPAWGISATNVPNWEDWYFAPVVSSSIDPNPHITMNNPVGKSALMSICAGASDEAIEALLRFADVHYDPVIKYTTNYGPKVGDDLYGVVETPTWDWIADEYGVLKATLVVDYSADCEYQNWVDLLQQVSSMTWSGSPVDRRAPSTDWYQWNIDSETGRAAGSYVAVYHSYPSYAYGGGKFSDVKKERIQDLSTSLSDYFQTETAKFITGARDLNDDEWEAFKKDLIDLGYNEYMDLQTEYFEAHYSK